jgi:HD-like signal output (HDOD) protein/CheY-like chemotaxis protein
MEPLRVLIVTHDETVHRAVGRLLRRLGHETMRATTAAVALDHISAEPPRVVLLGTQLPRVESRTILEHIDQGDGSISVIGMSAGSRMDELLELMRFGASDFVQLPLQEEELASALRRVAQRNVRRGTWPPDRPLRGENPAADDAPPERGFDPNLTGLPEESLVQRLHTTLRSLEEGRLPLPVVPSVAASVFEMLEDEECGVDKVTELISSDPLFAAAVIRCANSGYYGAARPASSLREACVHLGNAKVLSVAQEVLVARLREVEEVPLQALAARMSTTSQVVARTCRLLAPRLGTIDPDAAHLAGLMHNIGELFVIQALSTLAKAGGPRIESPEVVQRICASVHQPVGERFLRTWSAPDFVVTVAGAHHGDPPGTDEEIALRKLVMQAWSATIGIGYGYLPEHEGASLADLLPDLPSERAALLEALARRAAHGLANDGIDPPGDVE